ncbi:hypothetical protein Q7P35_002378 [Cladosporium inversicolor]
MYDARNESDRWADAAVAPIVSVNAFVLPDLPAIPKQNTAEMQSGSSQPSASDILRSPDHEPQNRQPVEMHAHQQEVEPKIDHQRNSPSQKDVSPRLPNPEDANADGNREREACDEGLAHSPEDSFSCEVGDPVQRSSVRDEESANEDVAGDEDAGYCEQVGAVGEIDGEVDEFEDEGEEEEVGGAPPATTVHVEAGQAAELWTVSVFSHEVNVTLRFRETQSSGYGTKGIRAIQSMLFADTLAALGRVRED